MGGSRRQARYRPHPDSPSRPPITADPGRPRLSSLRGGGSGGTTGRAVAPLRASGVTAGGSCHSGKSHRLPPGRTGIGRAHRRWRGVTRTSTGADGTSCGSLSGATVVASRATASPSSLPRSLDATLARAKQQSQRALVTGHRPDGALLNVRPLCLMRLTSPESTRESAYIDRNMDAFAARWK